jgi:hypothetical protein
MHMVTIDVAHPRRQPKQVEEELDAVLAKVRNHSTLRAVKVIHGYGSSGKGGATKETVRNWAYQRRRYLRAVIDGENYAIFDGDTQEMRAECGAIADLDLGAGNPGMTILWVK